jgi:hypothetical protein
MSPGPLGKFAHDQAWRTPSDQCALSDPQPTASVPLNLSLPEMSPESKPAHAELAVLSSSIWSQNCPSTFKPFTKTADALKSLEDGSALIKSFVDDKAAAMLHPPLHHIHDPATPGVFHPFETAFVRKFDGSENAPWVSLSILKIFTTF